MLRTSDWARTPIHEGDATSIPATLTLTNGFHVGFCTDPIVTAANHQGPQSAHAGIELPRTLCEGDEHALLTPLTVVWQYATGRLLHRSRADERSPFRSIPLPHAPLGTDAVLLSTFETHATSWLTHPETAHHLASYCERELGGRFFIYFAPAEGSLIVTTASSAPSLGSVVSAIFRASSSQISEKSFTIRDGWMKEISVQKPRKRSRRALSTRATTEARARISSLSPQTIENIF